MSSIDERSLIKLLLVQAVEERDPSFFKPEDLSNAALAALDAGNDIELLENRSAYLYLRLPKSIRAWESAALPPNRLFKAVAAIALALGVLSNYLGPNGRVHVAYNPLTFLHCLEPIYLLPVGVVASVQAEASPTNAHFARVLNRGLHDKSAARSSRRHGEQRREPVLGAWGSPTD